MKIKSLILFVLLMAVNLFANDKPFEGFRFCFDPGHDDYPRDKPYEARINIWVGEYLEEYLEELGADVLLTHTDTSTDLSLYERDQIANNFDADFFQSIHHNAIGQSNSKTNYTLVIYSKNNSGDWLEDNKLMCQIQCPLIYQALYTTSHKVYADYDLVGFNYGVLKTLNMPACLSEASFWDCVPEIMRLNSIRYLQVEAKAIRNAFLKYYEFPIPSSSTVYGQVIDDQNEPVKNAVVKMTNGTDTLVYSTDEENIGITEDDNSWWIGYVGRLTEVQNGFYFFEDYPAGEVVVWAEKENYVGVKDTVQVDEFDLTKHDLSLVSMVPPSGNVTYPDEEVLQDLPVKKRFAVTFDKMMNTDSVEKALSFIPATDGVRAKWYKDDTEMFIYHDAFKEDTDYQLIIDGSIACDQVGINADFDGDGVSGDSLVVNFHTEGGETSIDETAKEINAPQLHVAPNPVTGPAEINLHLPANKVTAKAKVTIYNCLGRKVKTFNEIQGGAKESTLHWNCRDDKGSPLGNGLYIVELDVDGEKIYKKTMVLK